MRYLIGFLVASALALTVHGQATQPTTDRSTGSGMDMSGSSMGMGTMMKMPDDMMPRCRMMNCPMMNMMGSPPATQPAQDQSAASQGHAAHH